MLTNRSAEREDSRLFYAGLAPFDVELLRMCQISYIGSDYSLIDYKIVIAQALQYLCELPLIH